MVVALVRPRNQLIRERGWDKRRTRDQTASAQERKGGKAGRAATKTREAHKRIGKSKTNRKARDDAGKAKKKTVSASDRVQYLHSAIATTTRD